MGADTNKTAISQKRESNNTQNHECAMQPRVSLVNLSSRSRQDSVEDQHAGETVSIIGWELTQTMSATISEKARRQNHECGRQQPQISLMVSRHAVGQKALKTRETVIMWMGADTNNATASAVKKQDTESRVRARSNLRFH